MKVGIETPPWKDLGARLEPGSCYRDDGQTYARGTGLASRSAQSLGSLAQVPILCFPLWLPSDLGVSWKQEPVPFSLAGCMGSLSSL